jgi:glucokinase
VSPEAIGADLGGTKMLVGVVDSDRRVHHRRAAPSHGLTQSALLELMERELRSAIDARPDAVAVGLGIPCTIDHARGVAINAVNLDLADVPIRDLLTDKLGSPVFVENDANLAVLAEHRFGAARGTRNALMLTIGTGIGGGVILDGRLYRGSTGAAGELGHMVVDLHGPRCQGNCPNHGCLEAVASGTALAREGGASSGKAVTDAALAGDAAAREAVATIGRRLGAGLSGLANIFEPDVIVIGGGVIAAGELLLAPAREELQGRALPPMNQTPLAAAELGPEAGMIGAATMAMEEVST